MKSLFTKHPASVGETYFQHMRHAASFSGMMFLGAFCCAVHALLPFMFERAGSRIISYLYGRMLVNRTALSGRDDLPANAAAGIGR